MSQADNLYDFAISQGERIDDMERQIANLKWIVTELLPYLTKEQREFGNKDLFQRALQAINGAT